MNQQNQRPNSQILTDNAPYPGLRPYNEEESGRFFGRDADARILLDKVLAHRLTLLFAATGVGKSSLLKAAVIPQLKSPRGKNLEVVYYNDWISSPLKNLKAEIEKTLHKNGSWPQDVAQNIDPNLSLTDFLEFCTLFTHHPLIIMLDQFEELFRYRKQYHQQTFKPFIEQLTGLITATHTPVNLVFSMREDFALELNAFKPKLPTLLFENYYRLERLTAKAAREAVLTPAEQVGFRYEPELLDQLIKDLLSRDLNRDPSSLASDEEAETVEPPYLQIVCSQLWEREQKSADSTFHFSTYTKAGGAKGLLNNYVQGVLKGFTDSERKIASKAFDHLISRRGTKMAHTPPDLAELVGLKEDELGKVLDKLAEQRVLRTQQRAEKTWYELYHDMFSESIEDWNTQWKNRMRVRRTIIGTAASLATLAGIYFGFIAYLQANNQHFRLGNDDYDKIEVYKGTSKYPDPFKQQQFIYETDLSRNQLEPDKRDAKRDIQNHASLIRELISSQPSSDRFQAYIENGDYCQVSTLIRQVIPESKAAPGCSDRKGLDNQTEAAPQTSSPASAKILPDRGNSIVEAVLSSINNIKTSWGLELFKQVTQGSRQTTRLRPYRDMGLPETLTQPVDFVAGEWLEQLKQATLEGGLPDTFGGDPRHFAILLTLLTQDNPREVFTRQEMAEILYDNFQRYDNHSLPGALSEALNITPSLHNLLSNQDTSLQKIATLLLSELNDPAAVDGWISLFAKAKSSQDFGTSVPPPILTNPRMTAALSTLLSDRNHLQETREYAATMLGNAGEVDAVPVLLAHLKDTTEWASIRAAAALALGQISDTRSAQDLLTLAANPQERVEVRLGAMEALTMMAYTDATPALLARFLDKQEAIEIRATIAVVLVLLGGTQYSATLLEHLTNKQENVEVREAIAASLAFPEDNEVVPALLQVFTDQTTEKKVKQAIINTLGIFRDNRAIPALLAYRESMDPYFHHEIDGILAGFDDPRSRQILESNAGDTLFYSYSYTYRNIIFTSTTQKSKLKHWLHVSTPINKYADDMRKSYVRFGMSLALEEGYLNVFGSHDDKRKLLAAINTADLIERRKLLTNLATNEAMHLTIRMGVLNLLSASEAKDDRHDLTATIQSITGLTKHTNPALRRQAIQTLASLETGRALLHYTQDPNLTPDMKNTALIRFVNTAPRDEAITELLTIIKDETNPLSTTAYQLLGKHHATEALTLLKEKLHTLEDEYQTWRNIRDQQTQIQNSNDNAALEQWRQQLKEATPEHAPMAKSYGYALAGMDAENAKLALSHELADIRAGAIDAVSKNFTPDKLQTLDASLQNVKSDEPIFHQAAFQAIDNALLRMEMTTQNEILTQLEHWHGTIKSRPNSDPVKQRLEWTIRMIRHYQTLDEEFQKTYQLKMVLPVDEQM